MLLLTSAANPRHPNLLMFTCSKNVLHGHLNLLSGQSYKYFTIVNYDYRVVIWANL